MDPTSLSNLDPKLKDTYERVMGTSTPAPADASAPTTPTASQTLADSAPAADSSTTENTLSPLPENTSPASAEPHPETVTINQPLPPTPAASAIIDKPHGHSGLIVVFYVLGAIVFFVIYIFFWAKIFNIALPF